MFGGEAVAKAVFGEFNPQGRLPITFPQHSGQLPVYYNALPGWHGGKYCDLPAEPLFAFGEGMGYSAFEYGDLCFDKETFKLAVKVKNAGDMDGVETVQVYMRDLYSSVLTPVKQLIAFAQVALKAGEEKTVEIELHRDDFSIVNRAGERVVEPGEFELMAGHSSKDSDLVKVCFTL